MSERIYLKSSKKSILKIAKLQILPKSDLIKQFLKLDRLQLLLQFPLPNLYILDCKDLALGVHMRKFPAFQAIALTIVEIHHLDYLQIRELKILFS